MLAEFTLRAPADDDAHGPMQHATICFAGGDHPKGRAAQRARTIWRDHRAYLCLHL